MHLQLGNRHASGNRRGYKSVETQLFPTLIGRQPERLQHHVLVLGLERVFLGLQPGRPEQTGLEHQVVVFCVRLPELFQVGEIAGLQVVVPDVLLERLGSQAKLRRRIVVLRIGFPIHRLISDAVIGRQFFTHNLTVETVLMMGLQVPEMIKPVAIALCCQLRSSASVSVIE